MTHPSADLSGERVVVTGGAGFIGSTIVLRLLQQGACVLVLDNLFTGNNNNLPIGHSRLEVVHGSVTDFALVRDVIRDATCVIHEAARNIIVSTSHPEQDYEVNIGGTLNVLMAVRGSRVQRTVYASTSSVYGNARYLPINEDDVTNTLNPYSASKLAGENYCKAFHESYGVSSAIVRYSNVYGPAQRWDNPYCGVVAKFLRAAMSGERLEVYGDGEDTRDYTYIDDAVDATLLVAFSSKADGQVFNIGTGRETTVTQLARMIIGVTGAHVETIRIDRRDIDNIRRRVLNIEKVRRELRWVPRVTLEQGLQKTYKWLLEISRCKQLSMPTSQSTAYSLGRVLKPFESL
jgi:UDP-glucose 4-epimerase